MPVGCLLTESERGIRVDPKPSGDLLWAPAFAQTANGRVLKFGQAREYTPRIRQRLCAHVPVAVRLWHIDVMPQVSPDLRRIVERSRPRI